MKIDTINSKLKTVETSMGTVKVFRNISIAGSSLALTTDVISLANALANFNVVNGLTVVLNTTTTTIAAIFAYQRQTELISLRARKQKLEYLKAKHSQKLIKKENNNLVANGKILNLVRENKYRGVSNRFGI